MDVAFFYFLSYCFPEPYVYFWSLKNGLPFLHNLQGEVVWLGEGRKGVAVSQSDTQPAALLGQATYTSGGFL